MGEDLTNREEEIKRGQREYEEQMRSIRERMRKIKLKFTEGVLTVLVEEGGNKIAFKRVEGNEKRRIVE